MNKTLTVSPKGAGREVVNGQTLYLVTSIKSSNKTISFSDAAPPVREDQTITLTNGKNDGPLTVSKILNSLTIQVIEPVIDEDNSLTKVSIK